MVLVRICWQVDNEILLFLFSRTSLYHATFCRKIYKSHGLLFHSRELDLLARGQPYKRELLKEPDNSISGFSKREILCKNDSVSIFAMIRQSGRQLTPKASPRTSVEREVTPRGLRLVVKHRHVLIPSLGTEYFSIHAIEVRSSMHGVDRVSHSCALGNHYWSCSIWTPACWKERSLVGFTLIDRGRWI